MKRESVVECETVHILSHAKPTVPACPVGKRPNAVCMAVWRRSAEPNKEVLV
ncbi:MAG: hypothetical protein K6F35_04640 [Lachnospiraceae bacterium]|nr:hypothetical protein [Lachnospiraceae bacterium]